MNAPPAASSTPNEPLYRRVSVDLLARIERGEFAIGSVMPREIDFAGELGVSRITLRKALDILEQGGVVKRVRKLGTQVIGNRLTNTYVQKMDGLDSVLRLAGQTAMRIDRVATEQGLAHPGLEGVANSSGHWMRIDGVRHMQGRDELSTWTTVFVDNRLSGIRPFLVGEVDSVYGLIERVYGLRVHTVRHRIGARALPPEASAALGLAAGTAALEVAAWLHAADGTLIEYVHSLHNPELISIELTSTRNG